MPLPAGLHGAAAQESVTAMIKRGWLDEVEANLRRGEPMWRETGDGHGTTLIATEAGLQAIGIDPVRIALGRNYKRGLLRRHTRLKASGWVTYHAVVWLCQTGRFGEAALQRATDAD